MTRLKAQMEEKGRIKEELNALVLSKTEECSRLEQEGVNLRSDLEKERIHEDKFKTISTLLDELIEK